MNAIRKSCQTMLLGVLLSALAGVCAHAGANEVLSDGRPIRWSTQAPISYLVNPNGVPGFTTDLQKALVAGAVDDAFRAWTVTPGTAIRFSDSGTSQLTGTVLDGVNVISFQDPAGTHPLPPGVLAVTTTSYAPAPGLYALPNGRQITAQFAGQIFDADILFNSSIAFSPNSVTAADIVSILEHEVGHMLGLDHTGVLSSVMNPFGESGDASSSRNLQTDDVITAASIYPAATFAADSGSITGTVTTSGGAAVKSADVVAISVPGGVPVASQLTGADGKFTIAGLPPGNYQIMLEPLDGPITTGNFPGFYSDGNPNFATTFFGGLASPTTVTLAAGQTASANITAPDPGAGLPNIRLMSGNLQSQGSSSFTFSSAPLYLPRGKAYQLTFAGDNLASDTNFRFSAPGSDITSQGGTTGATLASGQTVRQQNISISATAALGPSNVSLSGAGGTSVMPGGIVVTPNSSIVDVFNAASSGTSTGRRLGPGTLFSLYGADVAIKADNWLGAVPVPTLPVGAAAPTNLGGISVKFDNQYVPLFFTCPGPQPCGQFQQINGLIPFEAAPGPHTMSIVTGPNASSANFAVTLTASAPGLFSTDSSGNGQGAILNGSDNTVAAPAGTFPGSRPAAPGSVVVIYASGLGPVTPALPSGVGSGANGTGFPQLARLPHLTIGGVTVPASNFQFFGLSPTYVGLYQLNVVVPAGVPAGNAAVIVTTAEGQVSNTVTMAVGQ
jgi:uncharacterized protein (TIGR03437 family)